MIEKRRRSRAEAEKKLAATQSALNALREERQQIEETLNQGSALRPPGKRIETPMRVTPGPPAAPAAGRARIAPEDEAWVEDSESAAEPRRKTAR